MIREGLFAEGQRIAKFSSSSQDHKVGGNSAHSSHEHTQITTKLQNNLPGEPSEDGLNRTPITEEATSRLVERMKIQKGLVPHPCAVVGNQEGYFSCRGPA